MLLSTLSSSPGSELELFLKHASQLLQKFFPCASQSTRQQSRDGCAKKRPQLVNGKAVDVVQSQECLSFGGSAEIASANAREKACSMVNPAGNPS